MTLTPYRGRCHTCGHDHDRAVDHIALALAEAHAAPRIEWPKGRDAGRLEDMGPGHLRVVLDSDNDVCVEVWDGQQAAGVEFCNPGGGGGGRSSRTRMALIALMVAMEADNAERPDLQFPARHEPPNVLVTGPRRR